MLASLYVLTCTDGRFSASTDVCKTGAFGFDAEENFAAAREIKWPDEEFLHFLQFGFSEYTAPCPLVSWFAPLSVSIYKHCTVFE